MAKVNCSLPRVAFWLVPRRKERLLLKREIDSFAVRYSAPVFIPHVTLYSCNRTETQQELSLLASLSRQYSPLEISVHSLGSSAQRAQTFYLDMDRHEDTKELHKELVKRTPGRSSYAFNPHVSLIYQDLPEPERDKLLAEWDCPLKTICFDQLWAVAIPAQIKRQEDFYGWQPLLICQLDSLLNGDNL